MRRMQAPGMAYEDEAACLFMSPDATVPLPLDLGANFISGWVCGKHDGSGSIADSSGSSSDGGDGGIRSGCRGLSFTLRHGVLHPALGGLRVPDGQPALHAAEYRLISLSDHISSRQ